MSRFWQTLVTGRDNRSTDIGRVLFAIAILSAILLETFAVVWRGVAFDIVQFGGAVASLLLAGGASLAVKGHTEPSEGDHHEEHRVETTLSSG